MLENINLNLYKVFYYVATTKSFKNASEKLYVSQPAVSKQIKNLESILNVKLFYRFNKGVELTKEGKILLEQLEKVNFYLEASQKYLLDSKNLMSGELIIGCQSHITSFYLLKYIDKFRTDYPNINIKVISDSTSSLIEALIHHKIDFIVDNFPIEICSNDLIIKKIATFDTALITSNSYKEKIVSITDLDDKTFVLPLPRSSMRKNFENYLSKYDVNINVSVAVDTTDLIISSVKRNFGIGYVVKETVKEEIKNKNIREIKINCELPKLDLGLVYIKDYLSYPAKEFLKKYIKVI